MRLVFIHGWALDPGMWDALAPKLDAPQLRVDLGFFGAPDLPNLQGGDILIGHSLGLLWGLQNFDRWAGVVAINTFARFPRQANQGCVEPAALRALRRAVTRDPQQAVMKFREDLGLAAAPAPAQEARLIEQLDVLRDAKLEAPLRAPLLALAAQDDPLVPPAESARLAALGGRAPEWLEHGGHGLPWTAPAFCAHHIANFLRAQNV